MNLKMSRPKNETQDLSLSITKNYETLNRQTHRKPEEALEYKMTKPREIIFFNSGIPNDGFWMRGLTSFEVYNSIFNITEENCYF